MASETPPYLYSNEDLFYALCDLKESVSCDDTFYQSIINELWFRYLPLAYSVTNSYHIRVDRQHDFRAFGEDLLRECLEKYEPKATFTTYFKRVLLPRASTWLRQMESPVYVPDDAIEFSGRKKASPKAKEAEKERVRAGRTAATSPTPLYDTNNHLNVDVADTAPNPEEILIAKDLEEKLVSAMTKLTDLEQEIVKRVRDGEAFTEVGATLYLTAKQTSRVHKTALAKMRDYLEKGQS